MPRPPVVRAGLPPAEMRYWPSGLHLPWHALGSHGRPKGWRALQGRGYWQSRGPTKARIPLPASPKVGEWWPSRGAGLSPTAGSPAGMVRQQWLGGRLLLSCLGWKPLKSDVFHCSQLTAGCKHLAAQAARYHVRSPLSVLTCRCRRPLSGGSQPGSAHGTLLLSLRHDAWCGSQLVGFSHSVG